jgi:hypothetical protein
MFNSTNDIEVNFMKTQDSPKTNNRKKLFTVLGVVLGLCGMVAYAHHDLNTNYHYDGESYFQIDYGKESGPFLISHTSSGKYIHPSGGYTMPPENNKIVIHEGYHYACYWTFIPLSDKPGFGLIKHYSSEKFLHPLGGSTNPPNNNEIVTNWGAHEATVWSMNTGSKAIMHVGGKYWHP